MVQNQTPRPISWGWRMEMATVRRRLSAAAVTANSACLLAKMVQVGEVNRLAAKRRAWQQREERMVGPQQEADWLVATTGQEVVRKGRYWGK